MPDILYLRIFEKEEYLIRIAAYIEAKRVRRI